MPALRHLPMLVLFVSVVPGQLRGQKSKDQSPIGVQGTFGLGGGDQVGFTGAATLGPRIHTHLISIRGTWGAGVTENGRGRTNPVYEVGLLYGRRFCSPGACYSFGLGPGVINHVIRDPISGTSHRESHGGLMYQLGLGGTVTRTTTLGLTIIGDRNAGKNFWALVAGIQFGMPRQSSRADDDE